MKPIRVLIVEDNLDDAELMTHQLESAGFDCAAERVCRPDAFREALDREHWDVILSDFSMPQFSALAALSSLKETGRDIPFIIVSGSVGEVIAVQAMRAGAHDFFSKTNLARLASAVEREIREARNRRERRDALAELGRAEERYRLVVQNVRDYAIFMLDESGQIASWNPGAERVTGFSEAEVIGKPFDTLFTDEDRHSQKAGAVLRQAEAQGSHADEGWRIRRGGATYWARCTVERIASQSGPLGYSVVFQDVTDKKRLLDELREAVRARDEFLSIASHELKTPLTPMQIQLERLRKIRKAAPDAPLSDEKVAKILHTISRQAERLTVLVNNLLDVTRITSDRVALHVADVDLRDVVEAVVDRMRESIDRARCQVSLSVRGTVVGSWDRVRIEAVVTNLLSNAVKYGAGNPVEVTLSCDNFQARLAVRDHGIGISEEQQARIFEQFERAVPEEHYGGFGLGLWIVRQIVEAHGGSVAVESRMGEGSTFVITLPMNAVTP